VLYRVLPWGFQEMSLKTMGRKQITHLVGGEEVGLFTTD
jgi:hypothetical protein